MGTTVIPETRNVPTNGLFDDQHLLPAKIEVSPTQQANVDRLVAQMEQQQLFHADYNGMSDRKSLNC